MAKKRPEEKNVEATAEGAAVRHARIELPEPDYERLKRAANRVHISVAAYIRQAVMERIEQDEKRRGQ